MNMLMMQLGRCVALLGLVALTAAAQSVTREIKADTSDERYRIGPGDLLEIRVFNRPQLSRDAVRVDARGVIRMPLIEGEIQAACHTESEVAHTIRQHYLKYQRNPQVDVFVKEFNSQLVAVVGAVDKPGRFQLQRRIRLAELISLAGGPSEKAGKRVQVAHSGAPSLCQSATHRPLVASPDAVEVESTDYDIYNLHETLRSEEAANPYVEPGDVITVPEAEQVYVIGNVFKPSALPLKEPMTVSQAVAMAGGALPDTRTNRIRIIRKTSNQTKTGEIFVNLSEIAKHQADDVALAPGDIVEVPVSTGKRMLRTLTGALGPAFGNLPIYVLR